MTKKAKPDDGSGAYVLSIDDHVPYVDPAAYGITGLKGIKPSNYFITSGDAVVKATHLAADLAALTAAARRQGSAELVTALLAATKRARALVALLSEVRGTNVFLELEWKDHDLYCIPKNPRKKDLEE